MFDFSCITYLNPFLSNFASWYIYVMALFVLVCLGLAIWPAAGRLKIGMDDDVPEFSPEIVLKVRLY